MRTPAFFKKERRLILAIIFAVSLALFPIHPAKACVLGWDPISKCLLEGSSYFVYLVLTVVGNFIAALAGLLQRVINLPVYPANGVRIAVIDKSWEIMRNFANMFFIVALILMAFATIFDVLPGAAKYNARALFGRFLLTALLINFSLVIGVMVIQGTQVLSNTFLTAIGNMSGRLGQALNPSVLIKGLPATATGTIDHTVSQSLIQLVFALVLAVTFLLSLLTAVIFAFVRIPIIWALLVVSPIAWILNIFPGGEGKFKQWWSLFIGWNMFLPIFLFFLYFGLYFLQGQDAVMQAIAGSSSTGSILGDAITSVSFQTLFMYIMAGIFLIGGTIVAMKASMFSGTGVVSVASWSRGVAARRLGLTQAGTAAKQRLEQVQKEGLPTRFGQFLYGGERATELETLRRARQFGVKGALEKSVEIEKEKQKPFANNIEELRRLAERGSREQMLAARMRLTELGDQNFLTQSRINETLQMAGGERSELGNKYLLGVDPTKVTEATRTWISKTVKNIEVLKKNAIAMIEKDSLSQDEIQRLSRQFKNDTEKKEFLNKGYKKNLLAAAQVRMDLGFSEAKSIGEEVEKALGKMTEDQIIEMMSDPKFEFDAATGEIKSPEIRRAFANVLGKNPKKLENLAAKASGDSHKILSKMIEPARQQQIDKQAATLKIKNQKLKGQITAAEQERLTILSRVDSLKNYPTSEDYKQSLRDLESKEGEIKSLQGKVDKNDERIEDIEIRVRGS